jgi:hypothetical protein
MPRSFRKRINRRAAQLAREVYARFRDELQAAIAEDPSLIDQIDRWQPFDQRG